MRAMSIEEEEVRLVPEAPLTKDWVQSTLEERFGKRPIIKQAKILNDVIGYMSLIIRVDLDWPSANDSLLPAHVLAKIPNTQNADDAFEGVEGANHPERAAVMDEFQRQIHNTEIDVYKMFANYNKGKQSQALRVNVPDFYGGADIDSGHPVILIDFIDNAYTKDLVEGFNEEELEGICDEIAKLHAYSFETEEWKTVGKQYRDSMSETANESMGQMFGGMIGSLRGRNRPELTRCVALIEEHILSTNWQEDLSNKYDKNPESAVFNHGDLWAPQILWDKGSKGPKIVGIVDWAMPRPQSLTGDLLRVLNTCCSVEMKRRTKDKCLKRIHDVTKDLCELRNIKIQYDLEKLEADYIATLPCICLTTAFAVGMWSNSNVLKDGKNDEARIRELEDRLIDLVKETSKHHNWHF